MATSNTTKRVRTASAACTDVGRRRAHNEDSHWRDDDARFYIVADGVGGRSKGEIASAETVDLLRAWIIGAASELEGLFARCNDGDSEAVWEILRLLEAGIQSACYMVYGMAELDPEKRGMSTTCSTALFGGGFVFSGHVGDSRLYRLRKGTVCQLTEDHTLVNYKVRHGLLTAEEAKTAPGQNIITRAVGHRDYVHVDVMHFRVQPRDRYVLCSDGLHGYIRSDSEVRQMFDGSSLASSVRAATALANGRGGKDNITVVAIDVL